MNGSPDPGVALRHLAGEAGRFLDDPQGRDRFLAWIRPLFADLDGLEATLQGAREREVALELAAAGLEMAERQGDSQAQELFLSALERLAPAATLQAEWIRHRRSAGVPAR